MQMDLVMILIKWLKKGDKHFDINVSVVVDIEYGCTRK